MQQTKVSGKVFHGIIFEISKHKELEHLTLNF